VGSLARTTPVVAPDEEDAMMSRGDKLAFDKVVDEISFAYLALRPNCFCATPPSCKIYP
jgi:hypothetical protein